MRGYEVSDGELLLIKRDASDSEGWYNDYSTYGTRMRLFREYLADKSGGDRKHYVDAFNIDYLRGEQMMSVRYVTNSENIKKSDAKAVALDMLRTRPDSLLLIYNNPLTQQARDIIRKIKEPGTLSSVEHYLDIDLVFVSTEHSLCPSITLMTESEKRSVLEKSKARPKQFPKIKATDPVVVRGEYVAGDMLRIVRHEDVYSTASESTMIMRIVTP